MDDCITRENAISYLVSRLKIYDEDGYEVDDADMTKLVSRIISEIPLDLDVVKVVRCEDCAYWSRFRDSRLNPNHGTCFKQRLSPIVTYGRFYCAGGTRKEGAV